MISNERITNKTVENAHRNQPETDVPINVGTSLKETKT